jgi:hypothetical protein
MIYGAEHTFGARADTEWVYRGLRVATLENEVLRTVVLSDQGADVMSLVHKPTDTEFLLRTPWGVRNPRLYVPPGTSADAMWIDFYEGGWQSIFPNGGWGTSYKGLDLALHAESTLTPWDAHVIEDGPELASIRFRVRLARTPFEATRTMSVERGKPTLTVREAVKNLGGERFPVSYGQHIALGPPFLSEACLIDLPGGTVHNHPVEYSANHRLRADARSDWPHAVLKDGSTVDLREVPAPGSGYEDQAYIDDLVDGWYAVTNRRLGVGLAVRFPHELYHHLWYWQVFSGGSGYPWWSRTYNVGLEPFTSATNRGVQAAIDDGSALWMEPGDTVESVVHVTAFMSSSGVRSVDCDGTVAAN